MSEALSVFRIHTVGVRELQRDSSGVQLFKQVVDALRQIMIIDCPVYYENIYIPAVKDIIDNYRILSKLV